MVMSGDGIKQIPWPRNRPENATGADNKRKRRRKSC